MTIDEAIKILRRDSHAPGSVAFLDVIEAEKLGIEALKAIETYRQLYPFMASFLLPKETKE